MTLETAPVAEIVVIPVDEMEAKAVRLAKLQALAERLSIRRDECVRTKCEVESRWINSLCQYYGINHSEPTKREGVTSGNDRAPKPHMTRSRADRWEARLCDMLFPANDLPWDLKPTPQPDLAKEHDDQGNPIDAEDVRLAADEAAARMKRTVEDQLANCNFPRAGRRMIRDAVRMGTGLLMGPMRAVKVKRKFRHGPNGMALEIEEDVVPEIREADPWCFFPDMTETADKAEFAFYVHLMGALEVRNLAPGFDEEQIALLLREKPELGEVGRNIASRNLRLHQTEITKDRYAVWRYTGVLERDDLELLELCGCEEDGEEAETEIPPMAMVDLWFCQNHILRAKLAPIQNDFRIPYYVFAPFPADDTMFGLSIPELCEDSQKVAESAWLIALHNASVSSGPIFISRQGKIKPKDGQYVIRGPKWFEITDDTVALKDCFAVETIPNYVGEALQIFDRAMAIMDEELNTAQWGSPENSQEQQTASGLAMMMNIRSILQVRVATTADDEIFAPIIQRMYWHNMLYNPDESIKGDYDVAPLVQSVRLVKDVQTQHLQAFTMMAGDPRFAPYIDSYALLKANASMLEFPTAQLMKDRDTAEAELAEKGPPPQEMLMQAKTASEQARAAYLAAQTKSEETDAKIAQLMAALEAKAMQSDEVREERAFDMDIADRQVTHEERMRALDVREAETAARLSVAESREDIERMKLEILAVQKEREQTVGAESKAAETRGKLIAKGMDIERDAREMALKRQQGSGI